LESLSLLPSLSEENDRFLKDGLPAFLGLEEPGGRRFRMVFLLFKKE
jgi:hypothetical protein